MATSAFLKLLFIVAVAVVYKNVVYCIQVSGFAETPTSIITEFQNDVSENQNVLFRCRHKRLDTLYTWLINEVPSTRYSDVRVGSISESNRTFVDTLTIPAIPVYNGTEVVCVALFIDGSPSERTPPVFLIITGSPPTTTSQPTANPAATFEITPSPLTVAVEQEVATFNCQHLSSVGIAWLVNGTYLNKINSQNIFTHSSGTLHSLSIGTLVEYNGTTVQCVATSLDGSLPIPAPTVTLLIQDTPGKVENATTERNSSSSLLTTRWSSLPSLDLNDTDPDIVYSVELYKITCGEDIFMSREDVFVNSTNNTVDPMEIYKAIITARNNVEGARNGTSVEMREIFTSLREHMLLVLARNSEISTKLSKDHSPVPSYYTMILEPLDGHQEQNLMINISAERSGEMVNMSVDGEIPTKTLWNASLLAYGCQSDTVVKGVELSTHDIQNISVTSPQPGEVRVTGDFIDGSTATGLLVVVYSLTNDYDVHYIDGGSNSGLAGGEYKTSVFVVEENGLPFERVAALPKLVVVDRHEHKGLEVEAHSSSIEYSLQFTSTGVCITCTFLDSSTTDCVAVVHQRISQLNSSGLMNIESSHKLTRSGDTASGCIEGVNMDDYQVGVVRGRQAPSIIKTKESGAASSCQGCIAGAVLGVLVFILSAVVAGIVTLIVVRKKMRTKLHVHVPYETSGPSIPPTYDDVNQPENEATVNNLYDSIPVTNRQESRAELDESADEASEPLLSTPYLSPPLSMRQGVNRGYSDGSSDSSPRSEDTIETDLSSPSESNDDRILSYLDLPQLPGSTVVQPSTDLQDQSNEEESPPPVPLWTEDRDVLVEQSSNTSPSAQDKTLTNIQSPPDPTYAEPQLTGRAPVQTSSEEEQALHSPPPVPPRTEDSKVLLEGSSESSPSQSSPRIAVSIDPPPPPDPTYAEPQLPAVDQPQSKEKQEMSPSGESCGPTYALPVLPTSSPVTSLPPATEPVVYEDIKGFKNAEGHHYAMLEEIAKSKKTCRPDDHDQKPSVYSEIRPHSRGPTTPGVCVKQDTSSDKNSATPETHTDCPFTVEYIFPTLLFMASKWLALGEALSLDEDRLDEIFTNNETDEACLHVMLEHYMERSDLKHSWEEIREAMRKVEEKDGETRELDSISQRSPVKKRLDAGRTTPEYWPYNNKNSLDIQELLELQENEIHNNKWDQRLLDKGESLQQTTDKQDGFLSSDVNGEDIPTFKSEHDVSSALQTKCTSSNHQYTPPNLDSQTQTNTGSSKDTPPKAPGRTNMDELYPSQLSSPPPVSPCVFVVNEESQTKGCCQLTDCQELLDDLSHPYGEQNNDCHTQDQLAQYVSQDNAPGLRYQQPFPVSSDQNDGECCSITCQESEDDKTEYDTAIKKLLNLSSLSRRKRQESCHKNSVYHLNQPANLIPKQLPVPTRKIVESSSQSRLPCCSLSCTDSKTERHHLKCTGFTHETTVNQHHCNRTNHKLAAENVHDTIDFQVHNDSRHYDQCVQKRVCEYHQKHLIVHIQEIERTQICFEKACKIVIKFNLNFKCTTVVLVSYLSIMSYYYYTTFIISVLYSYLSLSVWVSLIRYHGLYYLNFFVQS